MEEASFRGAPVEWGCSQYWSVVLHCRVYYPSPGEGHSAGEGTVVGVQDPGPERGKEDFGARHG